MHATWFEAMRQEVYYRRDSHHSDSPIDGYNTRLLCRHVSSIPLITVSRTTSPVCQPRASHESIRINMHTHMHTHMHMHTRMYMHMHLILKLRISTQSRI